jgi:hypothetical protein
MKKRRWFISVIITLFITTMMVTTGFAQPPTPTFTGTFRHAGDSGGDSTCTQVPLPTAAIVVDGNSGDWAGIAAAITDPQGDDSPAYTGDDIQALYIAKDAEHLYVRMDLWKNANQSFGNGPPPGDGRYEIHVQGDTMTHYFEFGIVYDVYGIMELNGGALELIPDSLLRKAFAHLPPQVRQVLEAEARLRQMLTKTQATYEELEQIAAPFGDPPPGEGSREVPSGRWSYHSDGYFVRYLPSSYRQTTIQLAVPEPIQIVRDNLGRITAIADTAGNRIETGYDNTIAPLIMEDDADVIGYAFRSIRFIHPDPETGEILQAEWNDVGWTFVGNYANAIQAHRSIQRSRSVVVLLASRELSRDMLPNHRTGVLAQATFELQNDLWQRYKDAQARYNNVKGYFDQGKAYYDRLGNIVSKPSWNDIHNLADYKRYRDEIDVALKGDIGAKADWIGNHFEILQKAWLFAACMLVGDCEEDVPEKAYSETEPRLQLFNPSRDSAVPGNTGRQRLGLSLRPFRR